MSTKEPAFIIDEHNIFLSKIYKKDNYKEIIIDKEKRLCYIFFSGNGIYFPDTEETFTKTIIECDRYEWENIANSKELLEKAGKYIFVRDIYKCWYARGINEKINSIDKLYEKLKEMTTGYRVITVGNSAGGYMAALLGGMLKAELVYDFSGQFYLKNGEPKYKDICNYANGNIMYFFPALCNYDIEQYECIKNRGVCAFGFKTSTHGMSMYKANMPFILVQNKDYLVHLYEHYKGKQIVREEFFVRTCGWKKFVERIIKNVNKKVLTKLVNKNKYS